MKAPAPAPPRHRHRYRATASTAAAQARTPRRIYAEQPGSEARVELAIVGSFNIRRRAYEGSPVIITGTRTARSSMAPCRQCHARNRGEPAAPWSAQQPYGSSRGGRGSGRQRHRQAGSGIESAARHRDPGTSLRPCRRPALGMSDHRGMPGEYPGAEPGGAPSADGVRSVHRPARATADLHHRSTVAAGGVRLSHNTPSQLRPPERSCGLSSPAAGPAPDYAGSAERRRWNSSGVVCTQHHSAPASAGRCFRRGGFITSQYRLRQPARVARRRGEAAELWVPRAHQAGRRCRGGSRKLLRR